MTETLPAAQTREVVAQFQTMSGLAEAVDTLLARGFERTDLSMLGTHDSLEVAGDLAGYRRDPGASIAAGIANQAEVLGTIALAGALLLAAGPVGVAGAAIAATAAGALALRPFFAELVETAHADGLAQAVEQGRILLWVRTADAAAVERATAVLEAAGGADLTRLAHLRTEDSAR
jgi:hypothetical protein